MLIYFRDTSGSRSITERIQYGRILNPIGQNQASNGLRKSMVS
ncbi:hypothetical protein PAECIP111893_03808 [Paenibacillus plantiphilus]|uniref:Uncharacterized protein n=1 Tax=Paenibacillus plantiphilus TaxID=2905650 RepID=A0ABM9CJB9_9BACL|nr:hypothetical protein PAECIP111893_03808 [Paenibacillus plantiphilus]